MTTGEDGVVKVTSHVLSSEVVDTGHQCKEFFWKNNIVIKL
jgi:hypothetical protein